MAAGPQVNRFQQVEDVAGGVIPSMVWGRGRGVCGAVNICWFLVSEKRNKRLSVAPKSRVTQCTGIVFAKIPLTYDFNVISGF